MYLVQFYIRKYNYWFSFEECNNYIDAKKILENTLNRGSIMRIIEKSKFKRSSYL